MKRRPFQGVLTIVRFNWPFFAAGGLAIVLLLAAAAFLAAPFSLLALIAALLATFGILIPLAASWCAYDRSGLYDLVWLDPVAAGKSSAANIHAGFDETSPLIRCRYPEISLRVFDFYDPAKHTEASIRRARGIHPPDPRTVPIRCTQLPAENAEFDLILLLLAAHEIRDQGERETFFREIRRCLAADGRVVVLEHRRDLPNILAYSIGAWHFHTRRTWENTFAAAGLRIESTVKPNALITCQILRHDRTPA